MRRILPLLILTLAAPAPALAVPSCPTDEHLDRLTRFETRLRGADSVEDAQRMALRKVDLSRRAVDKAMVVVPGDEELAAHHEQLEAFADDVEDARSPDQVAERFATLRGQQVGGGCHYSTGEVIAIVIGFVLGIIPGIVLLFLLC